MALTPVPGWDSANRRISQRVRIAWDGTTFVDESAYVQSLRGTSELTSRDNGASGLGPAIADSCEIIFRNTGGRFSPNRSTGPYYNSIRPILADGVTRNANAGGYFRPVTVETGFNGSFLPAFTGVIVNPEEQWTERRIRLECQDRWVPLNRKTGKTAVYQNLRTDQILQEWLNVSGLGYSASLEKSPRTIAWAWLAEDSIGQDMTRLTEADGGLIYFDRSGIFRYRNPTWLLRQTTSQHTFLVNRFKSLAPALDFAGVRDKVTVTVKPRYRGLQTTIWELGEEISLEPSGTRTIEANFQEPVFAISSPAYRSKATDSDWEALSAANHPLESGTDASRLTVALSNQTAQFATVTLTNTDTVHRLYVRRLKIRGNPIVSGKELLVTVPSGATSSQSLSLDNPYFQDLVQGEAVGEAAYQYRRYPRQTVTIQGVPAIPHLEIGDRVTVTETTTGISRAFFIVRYEWRYSAGDGFKQDFDLIDAVGIASYADYFRIGLSALGPSGTSNGGRLYS